MSDQGRKDWLAVRSDLVDAMPGFLHEGANEAFVRLANRFPDGPPVIPPQLGEVHGKGEEDLERLRTMEPFSLEALKRFAMLPDLWDSIAEAEERALKIIQDAYRAYRDNPQYPF